MIKGHGGNIYELAQRLGCKPSEIIDMSSNVNPLGPPPGIAAFLKENISTIAALPQVDAGRAVNAFAERYHADPRYVLSGNGTTQFIYSIPLAIESKRALILGPTYADYADACIMHHVPYRYVMADESLGFRFDADHLKKEAKLSDTVFICNPDNPTGVLIPKDEIEFLCKSCPNTCFVIDESYLPFVSRGEAHSMISRGLSNVIVLNSMSKIFRVPGLRIGFVISSEGMIEKLNRYVLPWSVNSLAQAAVIYLMERQAETDGFIERTRAFLEAERKRFAECFEKASGIQMFPSTTSFMLARLFHHTAEQICARLAEERILIRNCSNFKGLSEDFIRVSLKTGEINKMLSEKLLKLTGKE
jgi:threonine-phosphate decarboxylase